ncbi:circadian-associated transcriptional repressor-like [Hypomesus transpacificus]|uniref:circadian-associated transcriptional repressor-like n=1 Tax=Hypomesus transpacificus TaxID=137520 RepID=UPI001F07AA9C|nr:circadian-associated transcriptional repressor-like [Hypomesus transpacificus]
MQSQGSTSSQPSFDSLSSSDSFLFSDSEQAEDDADVFLTESSHAVALGDVGGVTEEEADRLGRPGSQWECDGFAGHSEVKGFQGSEVAKPKDEEREKTEGDQVFTQKCAELQGFVRPLLELLHGLKRGRFDRGLSSFQQSVAMDRIQRIVGVLRRPNGGEKHLNTLLQVEMMLKLWFPHVSPQAPLPPSVSAPPERSPTPGASSCTPPHKHRDQRHIPVKKRRLSWPESDPAAPAPSLRKQPRPSGGEEGGGQGEEEVESPPLPLAGGGLHTAHDLSNASRQGDNRKEKEDESRDREGETSCSKASGWSEPSLTWVHVTPIFSATKPCSSHRGKPRDQKGIQPVPALPPSTSRGSPATQDCSISSTTPYNDSQNQQQPMGCHIQPVARQRVESMTSESCEGRSQPSFTVKPSGRPAPKTRVCSAPSKT